jgi:Spy/CpxP family protein refolding chaperone
MTMKRTMRIALVLGLLAAGLTARAVRAQEPGGAPDEPGWMADLGDDAGDGPMMAPDDMGGGGGMGPGGMGMGRGMRHGGRMMHRGAFGARLAEALDLTAEQREKMKAAQERQERKAIQARADIQLARLDLHKLMQADKPDSKAIEAQIDRIAGLRAGLQKSRVATMIEFRASLTPEQQKKLRDLREQGPRMRNPGAAPQKKGGDL